MRCDEVRCDVINAALERPPVYMQVIKSKIDFFLSLSVYVPEEYAYASAAVEKNKKTVLKLPHARTLFSTWRTTRKTCSRFRFGLIQRRVNTMITRALVSLPETSTYTCVYNTSSLVCLTQRRENMFIPPLTSIRDGSTCLYLLSWLMQR